MIEEQQNDKNTQEWNRQECVCLCVCVPEVFNSSINLQPCFLLFKSWPLHPPHVTLRSEDTENSAFRFSDSSCWSSADILHSSSEQTNSDVMFWVWSRENKTLTQTHTPGQVMPNTIRHILHVLKEVSGFVKHTRAMGGSWQYLTPPGPSWHSHLWTMDPSS